MTSLRRNSRTWSIVFFMLPLVALGLNLEAVAQTVATPCQDPIQRAFDFWSGKWNVFMADGTPVGRNTITPTQQGCVLVEQWQSVKGGTGISMNFYDIAQKQWRQFWISPQNQIEISGGMQNGNMVLVGTITYLKDGSHYPFRGTWTPLSDGSVRQFFEEAREPGHWQPWFEGFYQPPAKPLP